MNRFRILILLSFLSSINCHSQVSENEESKSKISHGGSLGVIQTANTYYGPNLFLNYTLQKRKSVYSLGIMLGPQLVLSASNTASFARKINTLNGFHGSYAIFPNSIDNRFDLFFQYDVTLINHIGKNYTDDLQSDTQLSYARRMVVNNFMSYGVRYSFTKFSYLYTSFGLGNNSEFGKHKYENGRITNYSAWFSFDGMIKLGLGFNL